MISAITSSKRQSRDCRLIDGAVTIGQTCLAFVIGNVGEKLHELQGFPRSANCNFVLVGWEVPGHTSLAQVEIDFKDFSRIVEGTFE